MLKCPRCSVASRDSNEKSLHGATPKLTHRGRSSHDRQGDSTLSPDDNPFCPLGGRRDQPVVAVIAVV